MTDAPTPARECQAQPQSDQMVCDRCALAWDAADQAPPCRPLTFGRMRQAAEDAANEIEASQSATVAAGLRSHRHQPSMARAQELRGVVRLIDRIVNTPAARATLAAKPVVRSVDEDEE